MNPVERLWMLFEGRDWNGAHLASSTTGETFASPAAALGT
jgi:hypothetical protein